MIKFLAHHLVNCVVKLEAVVVAVDGQILRKVALLLFREECVKDFLHFF